MSAYLDLTVKEVNLETADTVCVVFEPNAPFSYLPGQFLTLIAKINDQEVRRSYSLCTSPITDEYPAVAIKRVPGGLMSNHLNDQLRVGQTLRVMPPMGHFCTEVSSGNKRHAVLLGGGSGITPLLGIGKSVLAAEPESIVSLVYANRDENNIIFLNTWNHLKKDYTDRLHIVHSLDHAPMGWTGHQGILTPENLTKIIKQLPDFGVHNTEYFVCGPNGLMDAYIAALTQLGVPQDRIKKEVFVNNSENKDTTVTMAEANMQNQEALVEDDTKAYDVVIILDGEEHTINVEPDYNILEVALDEGIDMPYSCQSGLCTACRGKLLSGKVKMDETEGLSDEEMAQGYVLNCVGHPVTSNVKIEIG